ncbi:MAG: sigma-70 family RNA polymerase sigma factor [Isosphaeraceae bacterium]|nr:sigma-70 family RNA polymerase sigma factor [Isosphaeraceae bacterium]
MTVDRRNGALFRQIHGLFGRGTVAGADEGRLLERFVSRGDESAFEAIVSRFGPMVLGVCRRMLDDPDDVEDAFQATFLILVRKASRVRDRDLLGNWLYGVAYRVAVRTRSHVRRRQRREVARVEDEAVPASESRAGEWLDLRRVLDEEVSRLPEKYRIPVCLCYFQDQSYEEAAQRLQWPIGTVRSRLSKARELMRARLVRRGVALPAGFLAVALQSTLSEAARSPKLLEKTVTSAMQVAAAKAVSTGCVSGVVARLVREVMMSAFLVKLKWVSGVVLIVGAVGTGALVLARSQGGTAVGQRSTNLTNEPDAGTANGTENALPPLRTGLAINGEPEGREDQAADASATSTTVGQFVELLKAHPAKPSPAPERNGLYLLDVDRGDVTLVADEPDPGRTHCGSSWWAAAGNRILFDATPKANWNQTHLRSIARADGRLVQADLGPGNCPSLSPDGRRIAFIMNAGAAPGAEAGVWLMNSDGSERRRLGGYGRAKWAPDGRQLLVSAFNTPPEPTTLALLDVETGRTQPLTIPGQEVFSVPSWAGDGTIVTVLGTHHFAESIALVDLSNPDAATVKETLWKQENALAVDPSYPIYSAATERCIFVGEKRKDLALYSIQKGRPGPPRRLERVGHDKAITDLAGSPDGRYVIFCSDRSHRPPKAGTATVLQEEK